MGDLLPQNVNISLDVGQKILIVGANESGIQQFKGKGDERVLFMSIGDMCHTQELKIRNIGVALINGHIPTDKLGHAQAVIERAKIPVTLTVENGAHLTRLAEQYPYKSKGVVSLTAGGVVKQERLEVTQPQKPAPPPVNPAPSNPRPADTPPPASDTPPPSKAPLTVNDILGQLESIFSECGHDIGKAIKVARSLGLTEEKCSYQTIWGRLNTIRKRTKTTQQVVPELVVSELGGKLKSAIENAKTANDEVAELLGQVVKENENLGEVVEKLHTASQALNQIRDENTRLKERLNRFLEAAGLPLEV